jgi:O-acetylserine/cysteine efflux transporter
VSHEQLAAAALAAEAKSVTDPDPPAHEPGLPLRHILLALAITAVWGSNFVVVRVGLDAMPPLTFTALRFVFAALPAILFVRPPQVRLLPLAGYGLFTGLGQFGLLNLAMRHDITPGLASLVLQLQVFFTVALAAKIVREPIRGFQFAAMALAAAGLLVIGLSAKASATPLGMTLTLLAALSWAIANLCVKSAGRVNMLAYVVWSSLICAPPLVLWAVLAEGLGPTLEAVRAASLSTWLAVLWQSVGNTLFGYAAWGWLLARHPAATISPMSLLVPVFGMAASALLLAEPMQAWKLLAMGLIFAGLAINLLWSRIRPRLVAQAPA